MVVEWLWVTDTERIEQVVYDFRNAVLKSDADGVLAHMAPNVQYLHSETALSEALTRDLIRTNVSRVRFDFVRVSNLQTSVAQQARRGKAEFRVFTRGTVGLTPGMTDPGTAVTSWSLGFQETEPHVWKVNRISPVSIPREILAAPRLARCPQTDPRSASTMELESHDRANRRRGVGLESDWGAVYATSYLTVTERRTDCETRRGNFGFYCAGGFLRSGYSRMMSLCSFSR